MGGALWTVYLIYQFCVPLSPLSPRRVILYTRLFFPVLFPTYSLLLPKGVRAFAGPSRLCSCVAGRKAHKNRRCFVLSLGAILYTGSFFRDGRRRLPLLPPFGADPKAVFLQKVRSSPSFRPESARRKPCRLWTARRNCAHPPLYTARPICWLTFPLGSDTISIKHRKGRPAPWPSS